MLSDATEIHGVGKIQEPEEIVDEMHSLGSPLTGDHPILSTLTRPIKSFEQLDYHTVGLSSIAKTGLDSFLFLNN